MKSTTVQKIRGQIARYEYKLDLFKNLPKYEKPQEYLKIWGNFEKKSKLSQNIHIISNIPKLKSNMVKQGKKVKRLNKMNLH